MSSFAKDTIAVRNGDNIPIVTFKSGEIGDNINGPSVIAVPNWIKKPLGKYYMYFAHHNGKYIRLAYSDSPMGPWIISNNKILDIDSLKAFGYNNHVASPDVHIDEDNQKVIIYFHAPHKWPKEAEQRLLTKFNQLTGSANSEDGLEFKVTGNVPIAFSYLRAFKWNDNVYGLTARALVFRYDHKSWPDGSKTMIERKNAIGSWRHCSLHISGDRLFVFYTRWGDTPERIVVSYIDLKENWENWVLSPAVTVLIPQGEVEGANLALVASKKGAAHGALHELRDPYYFEDKGESYIYYSIAGEQGISVVKLSANWQELVVQSIKGNKLDLPGAVR